MKFKMTLSLIVSCLSLNAGFCEPSLKEHEQWWENSLDESVLYSTFAGWLGDIDSPSRVAVRKYLKDKNYRTILDVPSGICVDYYGFKKEIPELVYHGLDITPKLVNLAQEAGIDVALGSIEKIPFSNGQFDIAYARHILEHLSYYKKALTELIRIAKHEVLIVFFIPPSQDYEVIHYGKEDNGYMLYHNCYKRDELVKFIQSNKKVKRIAWEFVNIDEEILHIYLD